MMCRAKGQNFKCVCSYQLAQWRHDYYETKDNLLDEVERRMEVRQTQRHSHSLDSHMRLESGEGEDFQSDVYKHKSACELPITQQRY